MTLSISANGQPISGGQAIVQTLKYHQAGSLFGTSHPILAAYHTAVQQQGLQYVAITDPASCVDAACGYALLAHRPSICDSSAAAATKLIPGLLHANQRHLALVALVCRPDAHSHHNPFADSQQQIDKLRSACKAIINIDRVQDIPVLLQQALLLASRDPIGAVVVTMSESVCNTTHVFEELYFPSHELANGTPAVRCRPGRDELTNAVTLLSKAKKPLILAGAGIHSSQAAPALQSFAEAQNIPVAHTTNGKGAIACSHPLNIGVFGHHQRFANSLIAESDCLLAIACDLATISPYVQLHPTPLPNIIAVNSSLAQPTSEVTQYNMPIVSLWCDVREGLRDLQQALVTDAHRLSQLRKEYIGAIALKMVAWREAQQSTKSHQDGTITIEGVLQAINQLAPQDALLITDGSLATVWGSILYDTKQTGLGFCGLAETAEAPAYAIGAQLADKERPVIAITDSGCSDLLNKLELAKHLGLGCVFIVINRNQQYASTYSRLLKKSQFNITELAKSLDCHGVQVTQLAQLNVAFNDALASPQKPTVIDIMV